MLVQFLFSSLGSVSVVVKVFLQFWKLSMLEKLTQVTVNTLIEGKKLKGGNVITWSQSVCVHVSVSLVPWYNASRLKRQPACDEKGGGGVWDKMQS